MIPKKKRIGIGKSEKYICFILLNLLICISALGQDSPLGNIQGVVKDTSGETLVGVTIMVKDKPGVGTVTDIDGKFELKLPADAKTIIISYVGYKSQEIEIKNKTQLTITLGENATTLAEVQIVAYGVQKKETLTGSISSIGSEDLLKSPSASVGNALGGSLPGVSSVQMSGRPGGDDAKIYIRGIGSLTEDASSPLVLVDGVERSFSQLDANEIDNITVLKDASATAVFGVRGANGVILVTTKRGVEGKTRISITSSVGLQVPTRILKSVDSYTFAMAVTESQRNDEIPEKDFIFKAEAIEAFRTNSHPIVYPNVDWRKMLLKSETLQTQHNLSISGGTKSVRYFTSIGYLFQDGLFKVFDSEYNSNFNYNRVNYRSNIDIDVTKTTSLKLNIGGRIEKRNEPNTEDGMQHLWRNINWASPMSGAGLVDGKYVKTADDMYVPIKLKDGLQPWYGRGYTNRTKNVLNVDFAVSQKLDFVTKGLSIDAKASFNGDFIYNKTRSSSVEVYTPYFKRDVGGAADDMSVVYRISGENGNLNYSELYDKGRNWYLESALRYNNKFGLHDITGLILYNQSKSYYPEVFSEIPSGYVGLVGRATYNYNSRYLMELNAGYNGSENFAPGKRYGFFPSASAGWIISEESFMKEIRSINFFKIRGSIGLVGNDILKIGDVDQRFLYLKDSYTVGDGGYNFGVNVPQNLSGSREGKIGNPFITWEKALKQNYGFDMTVLNQRLSVSADYFYENRKDILANSSTTPGVVAAQLPALNLGKVVNRGYELSVKWDHKINDIRYWIHANVSFVRNKIIFKDEVKPNEPYMSRTGQPVGTPFGRHFYTFYKDGLTYPDGRPIANHSYTLKEGDAVYHDLNKDGVIDTNDVAPIGYGNRPEYTFGLRHGASYKDFDISLQWTAATNVDRVLGDVYRIPWGNEKYNRALFQYMYDERWTPETASSAKAPRFSSTGYSNNYQTSDLWVRDASYIRLKNIEIGYNFKGKMLKKAGIQSLRLYANGYNLLTFDKLKFQDPEESGENGGNYPLLKIYNFGLKVQF